ncbi:MAG: MarR family transcriptional regulator [Actinomycetota bacterium]
MSDERTTAASGCGEAAMTTEWTVGQRMHTFSNVIYGHFFSRSEQPFGVTLPEWRVLRSLVVDPGASQGEIAAAESLNVMSVSRAVAGLRRKGLVAVDSDPDDRRRSILSITELGAELGQDIVDRERLVYEHVFSALAEEDLQQMHDLLDRINPTIEAASFPPSPETNRDWPTVISENLAGRESPSPTR